MELLNRPLESLRFYEIALKKLEEEARTQSNQNRRGYLLLKHSEYKSRQEKLETFIHAGGTGANVLSEYQIADGAKYYGYERIFGEYMDDEVEEIFIDEPHLSLQPFLLNFQNFLSLAISKCKNLKYILVNTNQESEGYDTQTKFFETTKRELQEREIKLHIEFRKMHDRQVRVGNRCVVCVGYGLHYFQPFGNKENPTLGKFDNRFRVCKATTVRVIKIPENY